MPRNDSKNLEAIFFMIVKVYVIQLIYSIIFNFDNMEKPFISYDELNMDKIILEFCFKLWATFK